MLETMLLYKSLMDAARILDGKKKEVSEEDGLTTSGSAGNPAVFTGSRAGVLLAASNCG